MGKPGLILAVLLEWSYLVALIACFILALGNTPKGTYKIYLAMVSFWAFIMWYVLKQIPGRNPYQITYGILAIYFSHPSLYQSNQFKQRSTKASAFATYSRTMCFPH